MNSDEFRNHEDLFRMVPEIIHTQAMILGHNPDSCNGVTDEQVDKANWLFDALRGLMRIVETLPTNDLEDRQWEVTARHIAEGKEDGRWLRKVAGACVRATRRSCLRERGVDIDEGGAPSDAQALLGVLATLCTLYPKQVPLSLIRYNYGWLLEELDYIKEEAVS